MQPAGAHNAYTRTLLASGYTLASLHNEHDQLVDVLTGGIIQNAVVWDSYTFDMDSLKSWALRCIMADTEAKHPITKRPVKREELVALSLPSYAWEKNEGMQRLIDKLVSEVKAQAPNKRIAEAAPAAAEPMEIGSDFTEAFKKYKPQFIKHYFTAGRLPLFVGKWNSNTDGDRLPEFAVGQKGAEAWFQHFVDNPDQRAKMLRLLIQLEDLRPEPLEFSYDELVSLTIQTESALGIESAPVPASRSYAAPSYSAPAYVPPRQAPTQYYAPQAAAYGHYAMPPLMVAAQPPYYQGHYQEQAYHAAPPSAPPVAAVTPPSKMEVSSVSDADRAGRLRRMSENWITHFGSSGALGLLATSWDSNHLTLEEDALPAFGIGQGGAQTALNWFVARRSKIGALFALMVKKRDLRPDGLTEQEARKYADLRLLDKLNSNVPTPSSTTGKAARPFKMPAKPATAADREKCLSQLSEAWNTHFGILEPLTLLTVAWDSHITAITKFGVLGDFGSDHEAANTALQHFISYRTKIGSLFALLAISSDLRPEILSAEEAAYFADQDVLAQLRERTKANAR